MCSLPLTKKNSCCGPSLLRFHIYVYDVRLDAITVILQTHEKPGAIPKSRWGTSKNSKRENAIIALDATFHPHNECLQLPSIAHSWFKNRQAFIWLQYQKMLRKSYKQNGMKTKIFLLISYIIIFLYFPPCFLKIVRAATISTSIQRGTFAKHHSKQFDIQISALNSVTCSFPLSLWFWAPVKLKWP